MTTTKTTTNKYAVCIRYYHHHFKANAANVDEYYERYFDTKAEAWSYRNVVKAHAAARPELTVDLTIVELSTHAHAWRDMWNV